MASQRQMSSLLVFLVLWTILLFGSVICSAAASSIDSFLAERTGGSSSSKGVWIYSGQLCDPIDGKEICQVEGLELVRRLPEGSSRNFLKIQNDVAGFEDGNNNSSAADLSMTTLLSRKLFVYHTSGSGTGRIRKPLRSIRLRPKSPERKIPLEQSIVCYDTATTYVRRRDDKGEAAEEFVVHTEFPDGKRYAGSSKVVSSTPRALEFTVFAKKFNKKEGDQNSLLSRLLSTGNQRQSADEVTVAPQRSKFIEFGAGPKQDNRRFGARETYSYRIDQKEEESDGPASTIPIWRRFWKSPRSSSSSPEPKKIVSLKYARYGEGPPWYQVGKMCQLELQGERVDSIDDAPSLCATIAATMIPGFSVVDTPVDSPDDALQWFRQDSCKLLLDYHDDESGIMGGNRAGSSGATRRKRFIRRLKRGGANGWERVRRASQWNPPSTDDM